MSMRPNPGTGFPVVPVLIAGGMIVALVAVVTVVRGDEPSLEEEIAARQVRQAAPGETITCPNGQSVQTFFQRDADRFELVGTLTSLNSDALTIDAPQGEVSLAVATNVDSSESVLPGDLARIHGSVARDGVFVASGIEAVCQVFVADVSPETVVPTPVPEDGTGEQLPEAVPPTDDDDDDDDDDDRDDGGGFSLEGADDGRGRGNGNGGDGGNGRGNSNGNGDDDDDDDDDD